MKTTNEKTNRNKQANSEQKDSTRQQSNEKQTLLSLFEINIVRYALYADNIKSDQIDPFFMVDFMSLPEDFFLGDASQRYGNHFNLLISSYSVKYFLPEKFIYRYGTHYIHSAEFGGRILFEYSQAVDIDSDMSEMAENSWKEIQKAFGSSKSVGGDLSIPIKFITADVGGNIQNVKTNNNGHKTRNQAFDQMNKKFV